MPNQAERPVALITGASSGLGWATALLLAREGYDLCLSGRNGKALAQVVEEVQAEGARCIAITGDVTSMEDVANVVRHCHVEFGRIDVLVNDAAVQAYSYFEDYAWAEIEHLNDVNFYGYLRYARAVLPHMRQQHSGTIINVLSVLDQAGLQYFSMYSATKHALLGWAKCLSLELAGSGVKIGNVVLPSLNTPIYDHSLNRMGQLPKPVPPVYDVEVGAKAILDAIRLPKTKNVPVFLQGKFVLWLDYTLPWLGKAFMSLFGDRLQRRKEPQQPTDGNFWTVSPVITGPRGTLRSTASWKRYAPLLLIAVPIALLSRATSRGQVAPERKAA